MRVVVQRVNGASVTIDTYEKSSIEVGLLVLVGIEESDSNEDIQWITRKLLQMRIFNDERGKMNLSLTDINGELLIISQFTLHASTKKGNRPSFIQAARPEVAIPLYEAFIKEMKSNHQPEKVKTGEFGADMIVALVNDGPVTIVLDSKDKV